MWSKSSSREKAPEQSTEPIVTVGEATPSPIEPASRQTDLHVKIGKTIVVRGELSGGEDLIIEGRVEGKITLEGHHLTVGETGNIAAEVVANTVTIIGRMEGNLYAKERAELSESGTLTGDIRSPRVIIADGAKFKGSVDMSSGDSSSSGLSLSASSKRKNGETPQNRKREDVTAQKGS